MKKKNGEPYCPLCWLFNSGILTMSYYSPYITEKYNPLYTRNNQGFFMAQLINKQQLLKSAQGPKIPTLIGKVVGKPLGGGPLAV